MGVREMRQGGGEEDEARRGGVREMGQECWGEGNESYREAQMSQEGEGEENESRRLRYR